MISIKIITQELLPDSYVIRDMSPYSEECQFSGHRSRAGVVRKGSIERGKEKEEREGRKRGEEKGKRKVDRKEGRKGAEREKKNYNI